MNNFLHILSAPDNIPIIAMTVILCVVLQVAIKQAMDNDRLLDQGRFDDMTEQMKR
jgi:hypothetical protein